MILNSKHPFLNLSVELAEICKHLESFGIHHFTYLKQCKNGSKIGLSNKPQWIDDYYNKNLYQSSLFEKNSGYYQSAFNTWFGDYDLEVYQHGKLHYNTMHSITITEPQMDGCEAFLFSSTPDNAQAIHFLANNREILYHFILYLKDRGIAIFKSAEKNKLIIPSHLLQKDEQPSDNLLHGKTWYAEMEKRKKRFFQTTSIHRYVFEQQEYQGIKITQRQLDCIFYLLQNKTAAETAQLMNISRRTAESYLEDIKMKLNCKSKMDLIQKLKDNKYLLAIRGIYL